MELVEVVTDTLDDALAFDVQVAEVEVDVAVNHETIDDHVPLG